MGPLNPNLDMPDKANILVVDDLPEKLLVFRTVLEELGQNLVLVRSGGEALREVLEREFAVILLDVNMPDIDGFETAGLIRKYKRSAHTPIIFITAYADEMQTALGYSLGAVDYILSPVVPDILRSKVKVFVDLYQMQRKVQRQSEERLTLVEAEAARRAAEDNTRRSTFLSGASRVLGGSLDVRVGADRLLELIVPAVAPMAMLVLADGAPHGATVLRCEAASGGARIQRAEHAFAELPTSVQQAVERSMGLRCRVPLLPAQAAALSAGLRAMEASDAAAGAGEVLPLLAGERTLGALVVASGGSLADIATLEDLAERAAMAFENARLYRSLESEIVDRRQAEEKLQESNRRKDEFLAMLSHELRNPLAPIRNSVEVIRRIAPADPKLGWANEVMDRQVRQLTRLVDELLDVARISQGKIGLQLEPVDLVAVIAHSVETVRPYVDARHHQLTLQLPEHAVWLRGDFARLSQVVANLLNNAAKYTEDGGLLQLSLSVDRGDAVVSVRDNGIGIEKDLLPNVFELFEQGKRTLDRSQGGLGVGLTVVRRLVELHHGRVEAESAGPGHGAEFKVRLPCLAEVAAPEDTGVQAALPPPGACRVLVVDDNCDAAESVAMYLGMLGHEVRTVNDGKEALACAPVYAPQVVVLDIGLPVIDGFEVARRLRQMPQTAHALLCAMTGYGSQADQRRADEAGFDRYFVKPTDPAALAATITQWRESVEGQQAGGRKVQASS
jgi:signal transduction histidine kinase/DNA-binding response OmpR family regulator